MESLAYLGGVLSIGLFFLGVLMNRKDVAKTGIMFLVLIGLMLAIDASRVA